jgi:hypothetical protein
VTAGDQDSVICTEISVGRGQVPLAAIACRNEPAESSCKNDKNANAVKKGNCLSCILEISINLRNGKPRE